MMQLDFWIPYWKASRIGFVCSLIWNGKLIQLPHPGSSQNSETTEDSINLETLTVTHHRQNPSDLRNFLSARVTGPVIEVKAGATRAHKMRPL
jgi:hypothetical protein